MLSFCKCDEQELDDGTFPSSRQMYGMMGCVLGTLLTWIFYKRLKLPLEKFLNRGGWKGGWLSNDWKDGWLWNGWKGGWSWRRPPTRQETHEFRRPEPPRPAPPVAQQESRSETARRQEPVPQDVSHERERRHHHREESPRVVNSSRKRRRR